MWLHHTWQQQGLLLGFNIGLGKDTGMICVEKVQPVLLATHDTKEGLLVSTALVYLLGKMCGFGSTNTTFHNVPCL